MAKLPVNRYSSAAEMLEGMQAGVGAVIASVEPIPPTENKSDLQE